MAANRGHPATPGSPPTGALARERQEYLVRQCWDRTSDSYVDLGPTFLLCQDTGERALAMGTCPVHGGDACLFVYGKVRLLDPTYNPVIRYLVDRALREETTNADVS